jgi:hypothetical protein
VHTAVHDLRSCFWLQQLPSLCVHFVLFDTSWFCAPNLIGSQSALLDVCPAPSPSCGKATAWNAPTLGQLTNSPGAGVRRVRDAQKV